MKWFLVILVVMVGITMIMVHLFGGVRSALSSCEQELDLARSKERTNRIYKREMIATFIYNHSRRIDNDAARDIAIALMETRWPVFLTALIKRESSFDPSSISSAGAMGLGQIMPDLHEQELIEAGIIEERRDLLSIDGGVRATEYMWGKMLEDNSNDPVRAARAYLGADNENYVMRILSDFAFMSMHISNHDREINNITRRIEDR